MNAPLPHIAIPLNINALATKAMLVKLHSFKPGTERRDATAEQFTQSSLLDNGLKVTKQIFSSPTHPVRRLMAYQQNMYRHHMKHTLPYEDRGPRLLPVAMYETYRDEMRQQKRELERMLADVLANYDSLIALDIIQRGSRAVPEDYPSKQQFQEAFSTHFVFKPLPDQAHFLFDVSDEDRQALQDQITAVEQQAKDELRNRIKQPLTKLIDKLRVPIGDDGHIFRESAITNITEAVSLCRQMAMGDEGIIATCDQVERLMRPLEANPDALRESPVVRSEAAKRLAEVAALMGLD